MWQQFWSKLGTKERNAVKGVGIFLVGLVVLVGVGQTMKGNTEPTASVATDMGSKLQQANAKPAQ